MHRSRLVDVDSRVAGLQTRPAQAKMLPVEAHQKLSEIETEAKASLPGNEPRVVT